MIVMEVLGFRRGNEKLCDVGSNFRHEAIYTLTTEPFSSKRSGLAENIFLWPSYTALPLNIWGATLNWSLWMRRMLNSIGSIFAGGKCSGGKMSFISVY
jgi:hypothetical protein